MYKKTHDENTQITKTASQRLFYKFETIRIHTAQVKIPQKKNKENTFNSHSHRTRYYKKIKQLFLQNIP